MLSQFELQICRRYGHLDNVKRHLRLQLQLCCHDVTTVAGQQAKSDCRYTGRRYYYKERISSAEKPSPEDMSLLRDCRYKGQEHLLVTFFFFSEENKPCLPVCTLHPCRTVHIAACHLTVAWS